MKAETERTYRILDDKIQELDTKLSQLKAQIREFFSLSTELERLTQVGERFVADVLDREHIAQLETFYRSVLRGLYAKQ